MIEDIRNSAIIGDKIKILRYSDKNNNEVEKYRDLEGTIIKSNCDLTILEVKVNDEKLILNKKFSDEWEWVGSLKNKYLKSGAVILTEGCGFGLVVGDIIMFESDRWTSKENYNDDLIFKNKSTLDIYRVYQRNNNCFSDWSKDLELIWKREEEKYLTLSEVERRLGYKVTLLKGKKDE